MDGLRNLGIDGWGLVLYVVNFGILFFVVFKFLYKPLTDILDKREHLVKENISEAERLKTDFQREMDRRSKEQAEIVKQMQLELAETKAEAEARAKMVIAEAEARREQLLTEANAQIEDMKRRLVSDVEKDLLKKIETIAVRAMQDGADEAAVQKSVARAWKETQDSL